MATYTTIEHLTRRLDAQVLAGLADDTNTPPDLEDPATQAVITQAIADGAGLIDSYLLGRVDLSSLLVQAALERLNATLALYFLYRRRYLDDRENPLSSSREMVQAYLAQVAAGAAKLPADADGEPEQAVFSTTEGLKRRLDAPALKRF